MYTYDKLPEVSEFIVARPVKCRVSVGTVNLLGTLAPIALCDQGDARAKAY